MNEKAKKLGVNWSPNVSYAVVKNEKSGRWLGSISIGEMYYETESYKDKDCAVSELLGCLETLKLKTEQVIDELNEL